MSRRDGPARALRREAGRTASRRERAYDAPMKARGPNRISRVLILSADVGAGHLVAARSLARELERRGIEVAVEEDLRRSLGTLPRLVIRGGSRLLFERAPWLYDIYYRLLLRVPPARRASASWLRRLGARRLLRLVRRHQPDVIVSTYPGVTVVLGELRRRRRLQIPVLAVITDLAGLFFWAHRGVDMHLLAWRQSRPEVERISRASNATHVLAPTDPAFHTPVDRAAARARQGLPAHGAIVLVSGGGWGVGRLPQTVAAALDAGPEAVVVTTGRNERARHALETRFGTDPRVRVLGFTTNMSDLLAAADVLVHATAGVTCLEAALRGCPTVVHGFAVGHVRHNLDAMARLGLVSSAKDETELSETLRGIITEPDQRPAQRPVRALPSPADVVAAAQPRIRPLPRWWLITRRVPPVATALALVALSSSTGYAVAAHEFHIRPLKHVSTQKQEVALVLRPGPQQLDPLLERLAARHLPASLAVTEPPPPDLASAAAEDGVEFVPTLGKGPALHWIHTVARLHEVKRDLGERANMIYVVPRRGFTLGQYILAKTAHGRPVAPSRTPPDEIRPGDIIETNADWRSVIRLERALRARGIRTVTLNSLLADATN